MPNDAAYLGIDLGTSGARAIVMRHDGKVIAEGQSTMADHGTNHRDPKIWWQQLKRLCIARWPISMAATSSRFASMAHREL